MGPFTHARVRQNDDRTRLAGKTYHLLCAGSSLSLRERASCSLINKSSSGPPGCINSALQGVFNEKKE